jgi:hypothetical protein
LRRTRNVLPDEPSSFRDRVRRRLAQRRRPLPFSDRSILAVSVLLVLAVIPLWLDPQTLTDVAGSATVTVPPATRLHFLTPRPDVLTPGPSQALIPVAADDFDRKLSDTWGAADLGGAYSLAGTGVVSVAESAGFVQLAPDDAGTAVLSAVAMRDGELDFKVSFDRLPVDGELIAYGLLRVGENGAAYRMAVHVTSGGDVYIAIERLVGDQVGRVGSRVLISPVPSDSPGAVHVRAQASGGDPTTLSMWAWMDGEAQPTGSQLSTVDWTSGLQQAGAIGLGWRVAATPAQQLVLSFSAFAAWKNGVDE